ncbi:MAG: ABC transporter substrate-binding protein [Kiloniellales bacterium]
MLGIAVLAASPGRGQAAGTEDASAFLASLTDRAFAQLSDESLSMPERRQRFRILFREHFDVPAIGRFVLGRYWRKAKSPVREDFLSVFEEIMVRRFAPKFANYAETKFQIGLVRPLREKGQYMVASTVVPTEGEPLHIDWRVRDKDGRLKILDVVGQGISMALTLRSEYASAIKDSGGRVEGLVDKLRARIESDPDTQTTSNTEN